MEWVLLQIKDGTTFLSPPPPPPPPLSLSSPPSHSAGFNLNNKVSPSMLLIIIILAVIFFVSGLLHLLVRFLLRPPSGRSHDETDDVTALQGQLQQLFHLHDAGVDQSFIDGLPVFNYKAIVGGGAKKDPFDCAVCLCEFEGEDNLRLLPKCSHAFHMDCIDTWLLSHSTCPLCRASLLSEFSPNGHCSPIVLVLESGSSESSREIVSDNNNNIHRVNSHMSCFSDEGFKADPPRKSGEIVVENEDEREEREKIVEKVVYVKLGKFKNVDDGGGGGGEGGSSESNADARRCFSMGSFAYVMDEGSSLQVPIRTPIKKQSSSKKQCHRAAVSECGCDSRREFNGFEAFKILDIQSDGNVDNKSVGGGSGRESFSVSKIWLRGKKDKGGVVAGGGAADSSRRAFSFRFPLHWNVPVGGGKNGRSENGGSDDEEIESCNSLDFSQANSSSFGKGTLFWLMGRQNKIVHSSFSSNV
ncbi:hypothetical protein ACP275_10G138500 [Erythranthe tilingii]